MPDPQRPFRLGFLAFVEHSGVDGSTSTGLREGLELFRLAEDLGYDAGYVRHRHLERYLSAPLPFLTAAAARTERIRVGTSVTPLGFEHPVRLAEEAATVDLLTEGRLELGLSAGYTGFDGVFGDVFGHETGDLRSIVDARLDRFLAAIRGEVTGTIDRDMPLGPVGAEVGPLPISPGLASRVAYGAGSLRSAVRTGERGIGLQLSTLNTASGEATFEEAQRDLIRGYRAAHADSGAAQPSFASVARQILPVTRHGDLEDYDFLIQRDRTRQDAQARGELSMQFGKVATGSPDHVAESLAEDVALAEADELVIALPFDHPTDVVRKILVSAALDVAPALGWRPAAVTQRETREPGRFGGA